MPAKGEPNPGMDQLREIVAASLRAPPPLAHPDADTLSAFGQRALSEREQRQILAHLCECTDCREIVYLSAPIATETQPVLLASPARRSPQLALRWGTLAAAVAVGAILLVHTHHRNAISQLPQETAKPAPITAAELKTPPEIAAMHAREAQAAITSNKIIPTPKHMTAAPTAKLNFSANDEVRVSAADAEPAMHEPIEGRTSLSKLNSGAAGVPADKLGARNASGPIQASRADLVQTRSAISANGVIGGTLLDPSGAAISGANVILQKPTGTSIAQSDSQGRFLFNQLSPGFYSIRAQAPGFNTTALERVAVANNKASELHMTLQPGSTAESVEVNAAAQSAEVSPAPGVETDELVPAPVKSAPVAQVAQAQKQSDLGARQSLAYANAAPVAFPQWTLSPDGSLERSLDSGKTWRTVTVGRGSFRALSSTGAHVWVGGNSGMLYHSSDAGSRWAQVTPVYADRKLDSDIVGIDFTDPLNGMVRAANGERWTTSDGGKTWQMH
jgi:Carboxypeptidase regulatory-like domain/Photosynthesis system II assembly factor YCF48